MYATVRTWRNGWGWAVLAGLSLGASADVRSIGLILAVVLMVVIGCVSPGSWRGRLLRVALMAVTAAVPLGAYLVAHDHAPGTAKSFSFTTAANFNLYSRVAPFADCSKFTPPAGTRDLCIHIPVDKRPGSNAWVFSGISPAVQVYGEPDETSPRPGEDAKLEAFAKAAILGQPISYLEYVGRDLLRIIDPSFSSSPYGKHGVTGTGYGDTPAGLTAYYFDPQTSAGLGAVSAGYYTDGTVQQSISFLLTYERDTRIEGPLMAVLLALALLSPFLAKGHRRAAWLFLVPTVVLLAGPPFLVDYDYRYALPAFGALGCSAAIGAWGVCLQVRGRLARGHGAAGGQGDATTPAV